MELAKLLSETPGWASALRWNWRNHARAEQLAPDWPWQIWLILAGRGWGKTRTGAETVRQWVKDGYRRIALVGSTAADVRDVMIEGDSGLLNISPRHERPEYLASSRKLVWPNGAYALLFSAEEPDRLRGPQHDAAWADELAAWKYPEAYDMLMFGLRLGTNPRAIVTTTPRPTTVVRELLKGEGKSVAVTRGSTFDNAVNLASTFLDKIVTKYEGTRLGRQELYAEVLDDVPGALWNRTIIEQVRVHPVLDRIVVAIDPAVTSAETSDETGLVIAGRAQVNGIPHGYVLADLTLKASPDTWAKKACQAYHSYHADRIVAEVNNGGDLVETTLRMVDRNVAYKSVHASRGKRVRAEPVAALYEQGRVHHVGAHPLLEDQMCLFNPEDPAAMGSPDRVDALVWALTELMVDPMEPGVFVL
jgi:phage terminase large subunit-like protein